MYVNLNTIDADALMNKPLQRTRFLVDGLIPQGVNILCGASKIGKNRLVIDLAMKLFLIYEKTAAFLKD